MFLCFFWVKLLKTFLSVVLSLIVYRVLQIHVACLNAENDEWIILRCNLDECI